MFSSWSYFRSAITSFLNSTAVLMSSFISLAAYSRSLLCSIIVWSLWFKLCYNCILFARAASSIPSTFSYMSVIFSFSILRRNFSDLSSFYASVSESLKAFTGILSAALNSLSSIILLSTNYTSCLILSTRSLFCTSLLASCAFSFYSNF